MYERCMMCHGHVDFYGISVKPRWLRWVFCPVDALFTGCNEFGAPLVQTKRIPEDAYFVRFTNKGDLA